MKETKVTTGDFVRRAPRKKWILIGSAAAVLLVAGVLVALALRPDAADLEASKKRTVDQAVYGQVLNPNYDAAATNLEEQVGKTSKPSQKADIYTKLAAVAEQKEDYAKAADYYKKASETDSSRADSLAYDLAEVLRQSGDAAAAKPYYETALKYYQSLSSDTSNGKTYYINDIKTKLGQAQ